MLLNFQVALAVQVLRERARFTQEELAGRAGLAPDEVRRIEEGEIALDYLTAARLSEVLRVGLAEIAVAAHAIDPAMVRERYEQMLARSRASASRMV